MEKILISACLVGEKVSYNGKSNYSPKIQELLKKYELIPFCPEVEGGLSIPRSPCEIYKDKVISKEGNNFTNEYFYGARKALNICNYLGIKIAILKDRSPSCGSKVIHDGSFTTKVIPGMGITAKMLKEKGIKVLSEEDIDTLL